MLRGGVRDLAREEWLRRAVYRVFSTCPRCGAAQHLNASVFGAWGVCVNRECQYPEPLLWWRTPKWEET